MIGSNTSGRLEIFSYLIAEKAWLYRAVMGVFVDAKARFALHLRPSEILSALNAAESLEPVDGAALDGAALDGALHQLCAWGNLASHADTADVATAEEFYRQRLLYQITTAGEAAEHAVATYHSSLAQQGELQAAALSDIRALLGELEQMAGEDRPDQGKVHRTLNLLRVRFEELTNRAQRFIGSLQRSIELHAKDVTQLLEYKETLIDYLERFIGELVIATADIADTLQRIEKVGVTTILGIAAERELADAVTVRDEDRAAAAELWRQRWDGLRAWFLRLGEAPPQAEVLRARARSAIPSLLHAVAGIHEKRLTRSDRPADLRALARWFAAADSDGQAHRLWRAAFGLTPARHLKIDSESLAARDQEPVSAASSWLEAPPLEISPRLRRSGRHTRRGRPNNVIDRSQARQLLARLDAEEAQQISSAHQRLASGRELRLSELAMLDYRELELFLDLLGEALARKVDPDEVVEASSSDGRLHIRLVPTHDGAMAVIETSAGTLSGRDHLVTISRAATDEPPDALHEPAQSPAGAQL